MLVLLLLFLSLPAFSQNTKGDRAETPGRATKRENRFRMPFKKKDKRKASYRRAQAKGNSRAGSARRSLRSPKPKIYPQSKRYVNTSSTKPDSKTRVGQKVPGTRVPVRSQTSKSRNVYPQYGRYANKGTSPRSTQRVTRSAAPNAHRITRQPRKVQKFYPQSGRFVNNASKRPRNAQRPVSNRTTLAKLNRLQGGPNNTPPGKKRKVVPRSASRSFIARRSINIYASFPRPKKKGEQATTKDLAGRKLRMRNYETPRPKKTIAPTFKPYYGRKRIGDQSYKGPAAGKYRSATRTKPQAWTGDIAGRKIRGRNYSSKPRSAVGQSVFPRRRAKERFGDHPYRGPGGGYRSASQAGEKRTGINPVPGRSPGIGADRIGKFQGNIKRGRGFSDQGEEYTGTIKRRRPLKGGGSVSGRLWNNRQTPVPVRTPAGRDAAKAGGFPGKLRRFQNDPGFNDQGEEYTGSTKARRPLKGGGSVSGKLWNNRETPLPAQGPSRSTARAGAFTGNIKTRRPLKGGGSVSGKLWNNNETPIPTRTPPESAREIGGYPGKMRRFEHTPGFNDQGEEFTGYIRRPRFKKDYIRNPNAAEDAIKKKRPTKSTYKVDGLQVAVKQRDYVKNKNAAEDAMPKQKPTATTYKVGELQVKVKQPAYAKKPKAAEGALPGIKPSKSSVKASEFSRSIKRNFDYVHNGSSAKEALKVREPGKAFAKSTDYQGNIKMQKFKLFEKNRGLHPDAQFVKINKNNVDSERDLLTNFKLWWARLFKKEETQPDHLKEKGRKPRYDKGEEGLWND